jgi:D-serine deaminase-like pyridoxal phosphate-dependent protein
LHGIIFKFLQVREGVRSLAEVLALAREIEACPGLRLRGIATHHGRLEVFAPIVAALRSNVSEVRRPAACSSCKQHLMSAAA